MTHFSLEGKNVFITGASSGIGKACAELFAQHKANIVITGRRFDRLSDLACHLEKIHNIQVTPFQLDVRNPSEIGNVFSNLHQDIDILINNAGLALSSDKIQDADPKNWDIMIDTNIKGLLYVTKAALPSMIKKNSGHIINIGSIAGHEYYPSGNVYSATKHAVKAFSHSLRFDLFGTKIRVSEIAPGAVKTEFSEVRWNDKDKAQQFYQDFSPLRAEDIADAALYCATRPSHVNVSELVIYPQEQTCATQIHRKNSSPIQDPFFPNK